MAENDLLSFPESCIVGSIGELAFELAKGTEVPPEFYFAAGLTMLGAVAGDRLSLNLSFAAEPRLYTILIGGSYAVKKSTAMKTTIAFFEKLQLEHFPGICRGVGSAEGLVRELTDSPNLVLAFDELQMLLDKCSVNGSTLLPAVTSLFEQTHWHNSTKQKSNSFTVNNAHLSLLACCTLDTYSGIFTNAAISIGLPNRLFLVNAERKVKVAWPGKPDQAALSQVGTRIGQQLCKLPQELDITPEAKDAWEVWYQSPILDGSEHGRRLDTIGFRLMELIALTTDKASIDVETVKTVCQILNYEHNLRRLVDPINADGIIATMEEKIRRVLASKGPLKQRDLRNATNANRVGLWALETALSNLKKAGDISLDPRDSLFRLSTIEHDKAA